MPFTVLKVSKTNENQTEVVLEFADEREAHEFAEDLRRIDLSYSYEYLVEKLPLRVERTGTHWDFDPAVHKILNLCGYVWLRTDSVSKV